MQSYQIRVIEEHRELRERRRRLREFIEGDISRGVDSLERGRLLRQFTVMGQYLEILEERICNFEKEKNVMGEFTVVRLVNERGKEPLAPAPAYTIMKNGSPLFQLTGEQLDKIVEEHFLAGKAPVKP